MQSLIYKNNKNNLRVYTHNSTVLSEDIVEELKNYDEILLNRDLDSSLDLLPDNIKSIYFEDVRNYSHEINKLPANLQSLYFFGGSMLNSKLIINYLPNTLKDLIFPDYPVDKCCNLPTSLEVLQISNTKTAYELLDNISKLMNLKKLQIFGSFPCRLYNQQINLLNLPENLEILNISEIEINSLDNLPQNLKKLNISFIRGNINYNNLPNSLEVLKVLNKNNDNLEIDLLPNNLKNLLIYSSKETKFNYFNFPNNLEILHIDLVNNTMDNEAICIPLNIKNFSITLYNYYNIIFPENLINLKLLIEKNTNILLINSFILPKNIISLEIFDINSYNFTLNFNLPSSLKYLHLKVFFDFKDTLPLNLEVLHLEKFKGKLPKLPDKLKKLLISNKSNTNTNTNTNNEITLTNIIKEFPLQLDMFYFFINKGQEIPKITSNIKEFFITSLFSDNILNIKKNIKKFNLLGNLGKKLSSNIEISITNIDLKDDYMILKKIKDIKNYNFDFFKIFDSSVCLDSVCIYLHQLKSSEFDNKDNYLYKYDIDYNYQI